MHHTIIAVDVEGFGGRDGPHQTKVRDGLNTAMRSAFGRCGLDWADCHSEDRGDGLLVLVPPGTDTKRLVECLPNELAGNLRLHNATSDEQAKIRLRIVIHSGEIEQDRQGYSGPAVVHASRLLDSRALKKALKGSRGILALITSEEFFRNVIVPDPAANPFIYRRVRVVAKETRTTAWICLPDHHGPMRASWSEPGRHRVPRPRHRAAREDRRAGALPVRVLALTAVLLAGGMSGNVLAAVPPDHSCAEPVQLNVNVSAEKARVIRALAGEFEQDSRDDHGCKDVTVRVTVARSLDAVTAAFGHGWSGPNDLRMVGPEPHVVLPDSSWEYAAAVQALRAGAHTDISLENRGSIASSPVVLARPRRGTAAGGPADQPGSWADVLAAAQRAAPADGAPVYRPSPVSSGAGLAATIALYSAALGTTLDRDVLRTDGAPGALHRIELAVAAGDESGTLLCSLSQSKSGAAVLVSEKAAGDFNEGSPPGEGCSPGDGDRFDVTYPSAGTVYLDHPFVAVRRHDRPANPARDRVVAGFHDYLTGRHAQDELRRARFRVQGGDFVRYPGAPEGTPLRLAVNRVDVAALLEAFHQARKSARVLLLVDVSDAMADPFPDVGGTRLRAAADAVDRTLRSVGQRDAVGLWEFAAGLGGPVDHRVLVPVRPGAAEATRNALGGLRDSDRQPRMYDTLRAAVTGLRASADASADTSDAVVIVAAGAGAEDRPSRLADHLRASGVPVFLIAFGTGVCERTSTREITTETGGACHEVSDLEGVDTALDTVAAVLWGGGHD